MANEYWMANAEYISVTRRWLIGEDENANWWVPCHFRDTIRRDGWRRFHWYNPLDWLHYWHSRLSNQVVFLYG